VDVTLEVDDQARVIDVPADLAQALNNDKTAKANFDKLSYTHRREHVMAIERAKKTETRRRRIAKTIEQLGGKT
jgi:uncharacterized protein YdeI (YjbR/CyaY-like superfamily)